MVGRRGVSEAAFLGIVLGAALSGCTARSLEKPKVVPAPVHQDVHLESVNRNIDILFVIDNSLSMKPLQAHLNDNFPRFMNVLDGLPGGLPNVHIAVVSTNMGAGGNNNCGGMGDAGVFQSVARSPCTDTTLQGGATFIVNDGGVANYTGGIDQVFSCIANLGDGGCGFEQPLLAATRALGADPAYGQPAENAGFLRKDASLGVIFIANEDDCSARNGASDPLFDTSQKTLETSLGPIDSFRCNEFGHLCDGRAPGRRAPNGQVTDMMSYASCVSNEDSPYLKPVAAFVEEIRSLKDDPANQILVAAITGVPADNPEGPFPYGVHWRNPENAPDPAGPWPKVNHSCEVPNTVPEEYADPPVRLAQFVRAFGPNGSLHSICAQDFGPALETIAEKLSQLIGPKCVPGTLADKDGDRSNGLTSDCTVTDHFARSGGGGTSDVVVPACDQNGGAAPCWRLQPGDPNTNACAAGTFVMNVDRGGAAPPLKSTVACALCAPGVNAGSDCSRPETILDPRCPCP
jgi:hypothetical protein